MGPTARGVLLLSVLVACSDGPAATTDGGPTGDAAPQGDAAADAPSGSGIASKYPGDVGIGSDPDVIFFDDFESYGTANDLWNRWDNVYQVSDTAITTGANVFAGSQSLQFTLHQVSTEVANAVDKILSPEQDVVFLRYYSKFDTSFDIPTSSHNGGSISAHYFNGFNATPGVPADGTNKYLVNLEDFQPDTTVAPPGYLNLYVYWPLQRSNYGDHFLPNGDVYPNTSIKDDFGPQFVSRPNVIPSLGEWHCYEYMVKANTPGVSDGEVTVWLDGALVADFGNLVFRDIASLTIDHVGLNFHAGSNTIAETTKYYDNVVIAKSYVGPMAQ
jgi:hypothetical protein